MLVKKVNRYADFIIYLNFIMANFSFSKSLYKSVLLLCGTIYVMLILRQAQYRLYDKMVDDAFSC
ncbi:MAG: hypothetical protein CMP76_03980 [Flavobacterium sp.]|nr:hypothetical protein [Flavobacterium sp.]